ncbi:TetR/AcrR family transcriptional regulator [Thermaurantiacus sp.]
MSVPVKTDPSLTIVPSSVEIQSSVIGDVRLRILHASADLFSRFGFNGVSLSQVAIAAGVGKANILYHFESKERLWQEAVDWLYEQVDADLYRHQIAENPDNVWLEIRNATRVYLEACRRFPAFVRLPMVEGMTPSWRLEWIAKRHVRRHILAMRTLVTRMVEAGSLPPVNPFFFQYILSSGQIFVGLAPMFESAVEVDTTAPDFLDAYTESLMRLLAPTDPA